MAQRPSSQSEVTDQELVRLHREGRDGAFALLVGRYQEELFHFLVRFVNSRAAAEDIFQEAFLQVHVSIASFDTSRPFKPWLFTIAANKARDYLRRNNPRAATRLMQPLDDDGQGQIIDLIDAGVPLPDDQTQQAEVAQLVRATIAQLPDSMREILLLAYFHHLPYKEIAEMLDIPLGTVKSRLHAAVGTFAQQWKQKFPNP